MTYPVEAVLPDLLNALINGNNAVLIAPPGAGKTTLVAPALLNQPWCNDQILLLSPRRLAARMAAERIADLTGEKLGEGVGYATRMDSKQSDKTRILVLTEGIFRNRILNDPELTGVSAVLFDEVHERSIDSDFGLALALESQVAFRPDIRLLAMSATLDGDRFAGLMQDAPILESEGKSWPLNIRYVGRRAEKPIEDDMAWAIRNALRDEDGDILAFLPGVREIDRTAERLEMATAQIHKLHGQIDPKMQRAAVSPSQDGGRKIILATNIAETSLTIDGVRIVVDSGMARRARYDRMAGVTRLVTERASLSSATQRAGRAARQGAGIAIRLWEEAGNGGLPPFDPPEILESDLSPLLLDCALWGENDPAQLTWLDQPPVAGIAEARKRLIALDAIDENGGITAHGKSMAMLPLPPALSHMILRCASYGNAALGGEIAMLLSERGLGGQGEDLEQRLSRWRNDNGQKARAARNLAKNWSMKAAKLITADVDAVIDLSPAMAVAMAYPDRVCKARGKKGEDWQSTGGRGFRLDAASPLGSSQWLAVSDIQGKASGARILSAASMTQNEVEALFADRIEAGTHISFNPSTGGVNTQSGRRLGAITLSQGQDSNADPQAISDALVDGVIEYGLSLLPWSEKAIALRQRAQWAGIEKLSDAALIENAQLWLLPLLQSKRRLSQVDAGALYNAIKGVLDWDSQQHVENLAPQEFTSPAGTRHAIDYSAEAGPTVTLRVQALYGLSHHPTIGKQRIPLILSLTSPAGRPIQTTQDLPAFWSGSWNDVKKDMKGRYPKHNWPDNPAEAVASLATKKRQGI